MKKILVLLSLILIFSLLGCNKDINHELRIGVYSFGNNYHPYYFATADEKNIVDLLNIKLFDKNDELLSATKVSKNGYTYTFSINNDITSFDGNVTFDYRDLIFDFYYLLDPSYNGNSKLNTLPIKGLSDYYYKVSEALKVTKSEIQSELNKCSIEGITFTTNSISIEMTRKLNDLEEDILNIYLAPIEYYGSAKDFNIKENRFGFIKGSTKKQNIMYGLGKYYLKGINGTTMILSRNNAYYGIFPEIETIKIILIEEKVFNDDGYRIYGGDPFYLIDINEIDVAQVELNETTYDEIPRYNRNQELIGNVMSLFEYDKVNNLGYVFSTKRIDKDSFMSLELSSEYDLFNALEYIALK